MSSIMFLMLPPIVIAMGLLAIGVWKWSHRPREHGGIEDFRRGLDALDPTRGTRRPSRRARARR